MLRRLAHHQPDGFAFTPANHDWAEAQITKYPEGRQASAIIPLLWRAQEQEGWLSRPAIEHVADRLGMAYIRALEVATFYFMFQLHPVGSVAHVQICGTLSCMISGAEDLIGACRSRIAPEAHQLSADGKFSWEEVECLGACANAPMAQIGKDYYEDLTVERLGEIIDEMAAGTVPVPGPQTGRYASEPRSGLTSLGQYSDDRMAHNASVALALEIGDTIKRIDGTEVPLVAPWQGVEVQTIERPVEVAPEVIEANEPRPSAGVPVSPQGATEQESDVERTGRPESTVEGTPSGREVGTKPAMLASARDGSPDALTRIRGVGPKLEVLLHSLGVYHYDQVAAWSPAEVAWVDENLQGFKGRVTRDGWLEQARILADGGETEFSKRFKD